MNSPTAAPHPALIAGLVSVALAASVLAAAPAVADSPAIAAVNDHIDNDSVWHDTQDQPIKAQGGNVLKVDSTYYWVGTSMDPKGTASVAPAKAVNLYRSTDLENWTFVRALVTQWDNDLNDDGTADVPNSASPIPGGDPTGDLTQGEWLGRPQLVRHPDGRFIMTVEVAGDRVNSNSVGLGNAVGFFESTTGLDGEFTYRQKQYVDVTATDPAGITRGDGSLFVDGAKAYMVYVADSKQSRNAEGVRVAPLSADWLTILPHTHDDTQTQFEAPAITKIGSTYYMFASRKYWWDGTDTHYRTSTDPGNWAGAAWKKMSTNPVLEDAADPVRSFSTQFAQIFPVTSADGSTTSYLYSGDRYSQWYPGGAPAPAGLGRNAWFPVTFDAAGVPTLHGASEVDVDAAAGTLTWNPVANGGFGQGAAYDSYLPAPAKVSELKNYKAATEYQYPPRWKISGDTGAVKVQNRTGSDDRQLKLQSTSAFSASVAQELALPNGNYRITFDVKSSGGFGAAYLFVKNHGDAEKSVSMNTPASSWITLTKDFTVTTGKVRFGFFANGAAGKWVAVDNVSITPR